jgi:ribosomal protein S18 acetylase RimI-like enzyme
MNEMSIMTILAPNEITTVQLATSKDRGTIRHLECACFGRFRLLFGLWQRVGRHDTLSFVNEVNGVPAGYLIAYPNDLDGQPVMYVGGVGTLPQYRRRGLATHLMQAVFAKHASVWLHVRAGNIPAINMYRRLGMCPRQRLNGFYSNGDDALILVTPDLVPAQVEQTTLESIYDVI